MMHQYRYDPTADRWVIIAEGRRGRPEEFLRQPQRRISQSCPFCAGNEDQTPATLELFSSTDCEPDSLAEPSAAPWLVRVVPNKYPAAQLGDGAIEAAAGPWDGSSQPASYMPASYKMVGRGVHEVIIESPWHVSSFSDVDSQVAALTFLAYRNRMQAAGRVPGIRYAQVFKNEGSDAGASLDHTHSQLLATPFVPRDVQWERARSDCWYQQDRHCVFCHLLQQARQDDRVIAEANGLVAFCPFASRFPFEVWIVPLEHQSRFDLVDSGLAEAAGRLTQSVLRRIHKVTAQSPYNLWIHSDPFDTQGTPHYHWHIEIAPRYNPTAGYEFAGGVFINPVSPETAAQQLQIAAVEPNESQPSR